MRTKTLVLLLASASLALAAAACRGGETDNQAEAVDGNKSGIDLAAMDKSVKPGDDFFLYANGSWFKNTEIPADRSIDRRLLHHPAGAGKADGRR